MPCTVSRLVPDLSRTASRLDAELERRFLWRGETCSYVVGANKSFRLCHLCPEMGAMAIFVVACISGHMSILKFDCFLIARAELRPRGRNPRRHPNFPRKEVLFLRGIGNMRNLLDLKNLGAQSGPG